MTSKVAADFKTQAANKEVAKDEGRFGALAEKRYAERYPGTKLNELLQPGEGCVPCHRAGCHDRHKYVHTNSLMICYCCQECRSEEEADQKEKFAKNVKDGNMSRQAFNECDPMYVLGYAKAGTDLAKLRPEVLKLDNEYRPQFERCCRIVEKTNDGKLEDANAYFRQRAAKFKTRLQQTSGDMVENYRAAHEIFRGAFSAVCGAAAAAGLNPGQGDTVVAFDFKDPVRVQFKSATYVTESRKDVPFDELLKKMHNHSKNTDFLRFAVTVPNDRADLLKTIYDELTKRTAEEHFVNNKLTPKAYHGEQSMYVLMNFKLPKKGHAFEVQLRFHSFHELEHKQHRVFEWLRLLRRVHDVLPGESDEYEGEMEKDGRIVKVPLTPLTKLPGMKPHGEGTVYRGNSGNRYTGQWQHNMQHGRGTFTLATGDFYEGQWNDGHMEGEGFYSWACGNVYSGQFTKNQVTGFGIYRFSVGQVYEGQHVNGQFEGKGTQRWPDGSEFEGRWKKGQRIGVGIMWSADRTETHKWVDGKMSGQVSLEEAAKILKSVGFSGKAPPKR